MKTIQLMLLLSVVSAGIVHASDEPLEDLAYAVVPAAAPSIWQRLSSSLPSMPLPSMEGLTNSRPVNFLSSSWSNIARPVIESAGSASRYPVPTAISSRIAQLPGMQRLASLPRETQNLALGSVALPAGLFAAYKAAPYVRQGAEYLYQWWNNNNNNLEKLYRQIGYYEVQIILLGNRLENEAITKEQKDELTEERQVHIKNQLDLTLKAANLIEQLQRANQQLQEQQGVSSNDQAGWVSNLRSRIAGAAPSWPSSVSVPSFESIKSYLPWQNQNNSTQNRQQ